MLPVILPIIPPHDRYVETHCGMAAVFWAKRPSNEEIINDIDDHVVNFFRIVKDHFEELKEEINFTLHSRSVYAESLEIYKNPEAYSSVKRAWAFWIQTNMSFAGKPHGGWGNGSNTGDISHWGRTVANKRDNFISAYKSRLREVQIEKTDAIHLIKRKDSPETLFFVDTPYFNADMGPYKGFTEQDLIDTLELLSKIKGKFILTNYNSEPLTHFINENKWNKQEFEMKIHVTNKTDKTKTEVMVYNYDIKNDPKNINQVRLF